jgi:hypothetical protein
VTGHSVAWPFLLPGDSIQDKENDMATMTALDPGRTDDLNKAIELIANKTNAMITQMNTNTTGIKQIRDDIDALASPITISISTITVAAVNAAFVSQLGQLQTIINGLKA